MLRRDFLVRTGLSLGAGVLGAACKSAAAAKAAVGPDDPQDWERVRAQFALDPSMYEFAGFFLASHPRVVREAIEMHRRGLDANPHAYVSENMGKLEAAVLAAAADYLGVEPTDIALTDSTTMGLGLLYGGLALREGQDIVTTPYDHYSTQTALRLRSERTGVAVRTTQPFKDVHRVTVDEIVESIVCEITPSTRYVVITWVHSCTGLKMPVRRIADALATINAERGPGERIFLCVDGVHGLGIENTTLPDLGCDFFVAGTHKWLFGPRGTGLVWGTPEAWKLANATIPTFDHDAYMAWMRLPGTKPVTPAHAMTPGGFHSFEHRWALPEAFQMHRQIGKPRVEARIHELNLRVKEGLAAMPHVKLHTPMSDELSAGIVCFEVSGMQPDAVVERLAEKRRVNSTVTPYATRYCRLSAGLTTAPGGIEAALAEIAAMG